MKISTSRCSAFVIFFLLLCSYAAAQSRSIIGKVTDENSQPLADVKIIIVGIDNPRNLTTKTDKKGEYIYLLGLNPGIYHVVARKEGYVPKRESNVKPELGEEVTVDFTLAPGADYKFPHEMSSEEMKEYLKQVDAQKETRKYSAAVAEAFDKGVAFFDKKMYAEAIEEFNKALALDPAQAAITARVADAYLEMKRYEEALAGYEKAIALSPSDSKLYNNKGVVLDKLGKKKESREAFKKASDLSPNATGGAQNLYNLGVTLYNDGNMDEAAEAFKKCIAADSNYAEAYYLLGTILSGEQGTIPDAVTAFKKYVSLGGKPENVEVAKALIEALEASIK
jgi:tetratricopeptide (TPR) repeat protein